MPKIKSATLKGLERFELMSGAIIQKEDGRFYFVEGANQSLKESDERVFEEIDKRLLTIEEVSEIFRKHTHFKDDEGRDYQQHYEISDENWIRIIDVAIDVGKKVADACKRKSKQILIKEHDIKFEGEK